MALAGKAHGDKHHWLIFLTRNWIIPFSVLFGLYVILPFLSPLFYHWGWNGAGSLIQSIYSTQCHQLPDRSFFLFGSKVTYSLAELQQIGQPVENIARLRQFVGNPLMGWKVAWSDRMVSMYTSLLLFGLLWWPMRKKVSRLPFWGLVLFLLPMAIDGGTHFISDMMGGISGGFRYDNTWLAALTLHRLPELFYFGNALGSFNSWMRLLTGVLFGFGMVWFGFSYLDEVFQSTADGLEQSQKEAVSQGNPQPVHSHSSRGD